MIGFSLTPEQAEALQKAIEAAKNRTSTHSGGAGTAASHSRVSLRSVHPSPGVREVLRTPPPADRVAPLVRRAVAAPVQVAAPAKPKSRVSAPRATPQIVLGRNPVQRNSALGIGVAPPAAKKGCGCAKTPAARPTPARQATISSASPAKTAKFEALEAKLKAAKARRAEPATAPAPTVRLATQPQRPLSVPFVPSSVYQRAQTAAVPAKAVAPIVTLPTKAAAPVVAGSKFNLQEYITRVRAEALARADANAQ